MRILSALRNLAILGEDRRDGGGNIAAERYLDEDQRLVDHCRMEKGKAAPVRRIDAAAQIVPVADFVHRLIADDLLQHDRRRRPVDPPQHQEAAIEPGREQMHEIVIDGTQVVAMIERIHQLLAHADQRGSASGREIESAEEFLPARLGGDMHLGGGCVRRRRTPCIDRLDPSAPCRCRSAAPMPRRKRCAGRW